MKIPRLIFFLLLLQCTAFAEPEPESGPINFLVYPFLEVAGKPVKMETEFSFHRVKADQAKIVKAH